MQLLWEYTLNKVRFVFSCWNKQFLLKDGKLIVDSEVTIWVGDIRKVDIYPGKTSTPELLRSATDIGS